LEFYATLWNWLMAMRQMIRRATMKPSKSSRWSTP
jgi:hypothetical protein